MNRVALPIESKTREFMGRLWLAVNLADAGYEVVFGNKASIYGSLDIIEPDILFFECGKNRAEIIERLSSLKDCDVKVLLLQPEGSAFPGEERFKDRVTPEVFEHIDTYCAWGAEAARIARNNIDEADHDKIAVTGNPRFDLLFPDLREVYREEERDISTRYDEYVLINTSFSINHVDISRIDDYGVRVPELVHGYHAEMLGHFVSMIPKLSRELDEKKIVIRPHPGEDETFYEQYLYPFDNVYVKKEGEARPWIMGADAVIHNSCTTGVASALLETPVFAYTPIESRVHSSPIPNIVSSQIDSADELVEAIAEVANSDEDYEMDETQRENLQRHIYNIDELSADLIRREVDDLAGQSASGFSTTFQPGRRKRLSRAIFRLVGRDTIRKYNVPIQGPGSMPEYKFPGLDRTEVRAGIEKFESCSDVNGFTLETDPEVPEVVRIASSDTTGATDST